MLSPQHTPTEETVEIRLSLPKHLHNKIAAYQKLHDIKKFDTALIIWLEKIAKNADIKFHI